MHTYRRLDHKTRRGHAAGALRAQLLVAAHLFLFASGAPLAAQAPRVTPAGDPTVLADTIYALAVDPTAYGERDHVILLDDGIVIREHDGTGSATYRTVAQVLTRQAVEQWGELAFGYDAVDEEFRLNWARVIAPDGRVVSEAPAHTQVLDAPVAGVSPVFTDQKQVRVSLSGLEPGMIVDYSTTRVTTQPPRPGDFRASWLISMGEGVRRSRYVVEVPADYDLRIVDTPATMDPRVSVTGDRKVLVWSASDVEPMEPEYFEVRDQRNGFQRVLLGGPSTWADIGAWYAELSSDRYQLTDAVIAAAEQAVGDAQGIDALRALHRWIAQDFRYVSLSLGIGGYQPRPPSEVLETRSGDCKDKATLFIALARRYGFEAYPVLLHSTAGVEEELRSVAEFNHVIAAVSHGGEWIYLDLTAAIIPFGDIPGGYQGEFGLIVRDDGAVEEITFPLDPPEANLTHTIVEGTLDAQGRFEGSVTSSASGIIEHALRAAFAQDFTAGQTAEMAQGFASIVEGGRGESFEIFDGLDLESEASLSVAIRSDRATRQNVGGGQIFMLPVASYANPALLGELEAELPTRRAPIDIAAVVGPVTNVAQLHLTLPPGWTAELPDDVAATSRFGSYEARYAQEGNRVSVVRRLSGSRGTAPRDAFPELVEWLRQVSEDDAVFLLLRPPA